MAQRAVELCNHPDPDVACKALKIGLDKVVPTLEGVTLNDERPLGIASDEQLVKHLSAIRLASANGRSSGNGHSNGNGGTA